MALSLVADCKNISHDTPDGEKFIRFIDRHENTVDSREMYDMAFGLL